MYELSNQEQALERTCIQFCALTAILLRKGIITDKEMRTEITRLTAVVDQKLAEGREEWLGDLPPEIREHIEQFFEGEGDGSSDV
jgi:hypothetical protein